VRLDGTRFVIPYPEPTLGIERHPLAGGLCFSFGMVLRRAWVERDAFTDGMCICALFYAPPRDQPSDRWEELLMRELVGGHFAKLKPEQQREIVRSTVHAWIAHEVDEQLTLEDGTRPWDPHRDDPP